MRGCGEDVSTLSELIQEASYTCTRTPAEHDSTPPATHDRHQQCLTPFAPPATHDHRQQYLAPVAPELCDIGNLLLVTTPHQPPPPPSPPIPPLLLLSPLPRGARICYTITVADQNRAHRSFIHRSRQVLHVGKEVVMFGDDQFHAIRRSRCRCHRFSEAHFLFVDLNDNAINPFCQRRLRRGSRRGGGQDTCRWQQHTSDRCVSRLAQVRARGMRCNNCCGALATTSASSFGRAEVTHACALCVGQQEGGMPFERGSTRVVGKGQHEGGVPFERGSKSEWWKRAKKARESTRP